MTAINKRIERFTEIDIDEEIIIMRLDTGDFFALSGTAAAIWRLIDGDRDQAAVLSALASEFATEEVQASTDVDEFLVQLKDLGLLAGA